MGWSPFATLGRILRVRDVHRDIHAWFWGVLEAVEIKAEHLDLDLADSPDLEEFIRQEEGRSSSPMDDGEHESLSFQDPGG